MFNSLIACPVCGKGIEQAQLAKDSRLTEEMRYWTFENTTRMPTNAKAFDYLKVTAAKPAYLVTLLGEYGVGKTRLLACLVNAGIAAGQTSIYLTTAELMDHLRLAYEPNAPQSVDETWRTIADARILVLDETDQFQSTEWAVLKFRQLVDERYRSGMDHCTAFATNKKLETLPGYLVSRLRDANCRVFEIGGGDIRQVARGAI